MLAEDKDMKTFFMSNDFCQFFDAIKLQYVQKGILSLGVLGFHLLLNKLSNLTRLVVIQSNMVVTFPN